MFNVLHSQTLLPELMAANAWLQKAAFFKPSQPCDEGTEGRVVDLTRSVNTRVVVVLS